MPVKIHKLPKLILSEQVYICSFPDGKDYEYEVGIVKSNGRYKIKIFEERWGDKEDWERRIANLQEIVKNLP